MEELIEVVKNEEEEKKRFLKHVVRLLVKKKMIVEENLLDQRTQVVQQMHLVVLKSSWRKRLKGQTYCKLDLHHFCLPSYYDLSSQC